MSAFGQDGPYAQFGLHDTEASAGRGAFSQEEDRVITSSMFGVLLADASGGLHAALGVLGALLARAESDRGTNIGVALADCISTFNLAGLQQALAAGTVRGPTHLDRASFRRKDGKFIVQANTEPENWRRFCGAIGRPDLVDLPGADVETRQRGVAQIREIMLARTRDEWFEVITTSGASAARYLEPAEVVEDRQVEARGLARELQHPTEGAVRQWGFPIRFDDMPAEVGVASFAPAPGEHTAAVLAELGYAASEIDAMG